MFYIGAHVDCACLTIGPPGLYPKQTIAGCVFPSPGFPDPITFLASECVPTPNGVSKGLAAARRGALK